MLTLKLKKLTYHCYHGRGGEDGGMTRGLRIFLKNCSFVIFNFRVICKSESVWLQFSDFFIFKSLANLLSNIKISNGLKVKKMFLFNVPNHLITNNNLLYC